MIFKGKTSSGFSYTIDDTRIFDNYRFTKKMVDVRKYTGKDDEKATIASSDMLELFFGEEQLERLAEHLEKKNGVATNSDIYGEFSEIMKTIADKRNAEKN